MSKYDPDELARRLDQLLPPDARSTPPRGDNDPLVDAAIRLANTPPPAMTPEVVARIQARVMQQVNAQPAQPSVTRFLAPLRWVAAACLVLVIFAAGLTPAMAQSVPGDALYPVKLALEQVELALAGDQAARAAVHLNHAERRAQEAITLLERDQFDAGLIDAALDAMQLATEAARQVTTAAESTALSSRMTTLSRLLDDVLQEADLRHLAPPETLAVITHELDTARQNGSLLLVTPLPAMTPTPTPTSPPTAAAPVVVSQSPVASATSTASPTATASATSTPEPTVSESAAPTASSTITPYTAFIDANGLVNVRSGPGITFDILAVVQPGTRVTVRGQNPDRTWLFIALPDRREGWIASWLVFVGETPPSYPPAGGEDHAVDGPTPIPPEPAAAPPDSPPSQPSVDGSQPLDGDPGDFGCEKPGNYCNAPGQTKKK